MAFGSPPRKRGLIICGLVGRYPGVYAEGFGANGREGFGCEPGYLLVKAAAVDIAELGEHRECGLASNKSERQFPRTWTRTCGERKRKKGIHVVLAQHDHRTGEARALAIDLIAEIDTQMRPPDFALTKKHRFNVNVEQLLLLVPVVEVFAVLACIHNYCEDAE